MFLLLHILKQFRSRLLESVLAVVAITLAVAVVTAAGAFAYTSWQVSRNFEQSLASREIAISAGGSQPRFPPGIDAVRIGAAPTRATPLSLLDLEAIKEAAPSVDFAYYWQAERLWIAGWREDEALEALAITEEFLLAANIEVKAGNLLRSEDFAEGRRVLLVSDEAVRHLKLAGDPIGQQVTFDGMPLTPTFTIVGILAETTVGLLTDVKVDALYPYQSYPNRQPLRTSVPWEVGWLNFAVRDSSTLDTALEQLAVYADKRFGEGWARVSARRNPGQLSDQQRLTASMIAIFAATGLMMTSLNIMNLMLARVMRKYRDIGIRRSLGASREYIHRLFLAESLTLGLIGGCLGVWLSLGLLRWYNGVLSQFDRHIAMQIGFRVEPSPVAMAVGVGIAVAASLLFSVYPARQASRFRIVEAIRDDQVGMARKSARIQWLPCMSIRRVTIGIQMTLGALVLVIGLGGYVDSVAKVQRDAFYLVARPIDSTLYTTLFDESDLPALRSLAPAVVELAAYELNLVAIPEVIRGSERFALRSAARASPAYVDIAGIELVEGSFFTDLDVQQQARVAVISEDAARVVFGSESAVGHDVVIPGLGFGPQWRGEIIGVYKHRPVVHHSSQSMVTAATPTLLYPSWVSGMLDSQFMTLAAAPKPGREQEAREQLLAAARHYYRGVRVVGAFVDDDYFVIEDLHTSEFFNPTTVIVSVFAAIALTISLIGIFSSTVLGVSYDARAIGMKRALGASQRHVMLAFVKGAVGTALVAGTLGVVLAALLIPWLKAQAGTAFIGTLELRFELWLGALVVLLVVLVNAGLGLIPARHLSRGQPAEALREG